MVFRSKFTLSRVLKHFLVKLHIARWGYEVDNYCDFVMILTMRIQISNRYALLLLIDLVQIIPQKWETDELDLFISSESDSVSGLVSKPCHQTFQILYHALKLFVLVLPGLSVVSGTLMWGLIDVMTFELHHRNSMQCKCISMGSSMLAFVRAVSRMQATA